MFYALKIPSPKIFILLKTINLIRAFVYWAMVLWFSDQKSKPLEIEDKIIITLVINEHVTYKKLTR